MTTAALTLPAPDPVQLRLPPPPGKCQCGLKLSVLDVDGICLECQTYPLDAVVNPCARCGKKPRAHAQAYCLECLSAYNREYHEKRKYNKSPDNPCACCGKAPRHNGGSYCVKCGSAYQAERQQRRKAQP